MFPSFHQQMTESVLRIAVEGCCHGELDKIYAHITTQPYEKWPELLIICGDFQSIRNEQDLDSIAVPDKFKRIGDFKDYYEGLKKAPILTIFIGGNHEASAYLQELPNGGWVAENIYYMGYSNVIWFKGLRIGGISGIYKFFDFYKNHYEQAPFDDKSKRSVYHVRFEDFLKLSLVRDLNLNCFLSHDWPEGIVKYGNMKYLLQKKPFFKKDIENNCLGSVPAKLLLQRLMPHYWFSAHLHVRFQAFVKHAPIKRKLSNDVEIGEKKLKVNNDEIDLDEEIPDTNEINLDLDEDDNDNEIQLDLDDDDKSPQPTAKTFAKGFSQTNFLALDKCLPKRQFIETIEIPVTNNDHESHNSKELYYDLEYLKITKWFEKFKNSEVFKDLKMHNVDDHLVEELWRDIDEVEIDMDLRIPKNFEPVLQNAKKQTDEFNEKLFR